jgi:hypothetical protein
MSAQLLKRRLLTVEEYYWMAERELSKDERMELIEGEIVTMAAVGSRHAACIDRLNYLLSQKTAIIGAGLIEKWLTVCQASNLLR